MAVISVIELKRYTEKNSAVRSVWLIPLTLPIDLVIVNEHGVRLIQVKKDGQRKNPGRNKQARIHRTRSDLQKQLGVEMVYVNPDTRSVTVTDHDYHKAANDNEKGEE